MSRLHPKSAISSDAIDAILPQTQCTRCGYPCCRDYAEAIARGDAKINQCPPGGDAGIRALSGLTGITYQPLNPIHGQEGPMAIAIIDESRCIGCTLCIKACPVDAIVGGFKHMHTVLAEDCTGCELCVAPCPVDCIAMIRPHPPRDWGRQDADRAKAQYNARQRRLEHQSGQDADPSPAPEQIARILAKAKQRARQRAAGPGTDGTE